MRYIKDLIKKLLSCRLMKTIYRKNEKIKARLYETLGTLRSIYYRAVLAECGENLTIYGKPKIFQPEKIHLGNNVTINNCVQISPRAEVYIGDNVTMSRGSQITAGTLDISNWVDGNYILRKHTQGEVYLAEGTWLCVNSIILPGVKISGKGVIVAAGAVVTKDIVEDFVIVAGIPAKVVKHLK